MSDVDLNQMELLAQVDHLLRQARVWTESASPWHPAVQAQGLLRRVLARTDSLRIRLEAPLVVATFGGTGTGKSSLVNALVGAGVTQSGRQRPTTRQPIVICHSQTDVTQIGLPLESCELVRSDSDLVRDLVIVDCPDPDTNETETPGSNLALLHSLLPFCDVLLYVSTQQKYRSARVTTELAQAASGCRVIFVQTHADLDEDIRSDWSRQLSATFTEPEIFFVDSQLAFREQLSGQRPTGEMGRLVDLLMRELGSASRVRIRRANVVDLLSEAIDRCQAPLTAAEAELSTLEHMLLEQRGQLAQRMTQQLCKDLGASRGLWERRLVEAVVENWGLSPFSAVLRAYHGLGSILMSLSLTRARSTAQMAVIGAVHGFRMLRERAERQSAEDGLQRASSLGLDDSLLRETELIIEGHVRSAGFDRSLLPSSSLDQLREQAAWIESQFLGDASQKTDELIHLLAAKNSRWWVRGWYELLFLSYLGFVLYRIGRNFFHDSFLQDKPLLSTDFYMPAGIFWVLWTGVLLMLFLRRLRSGLQREIQGLATQLVDVRLAGGLFPQLEQACRVARQQSQELSQLREAVERIRTLVATGTNLGARRGAPR
jgi:Dynamin family